MWRMGVGRDKADCSTKVSLEIQVHIDMMVWHVNRSTFNFRLMLHFIQQYLQSKDVWNVTWKAGSGHNTGISLVLFSLHFWIEYNNNTLHQMVRALCRATYQTFIIVWCCVNSPCKCCKADVGSSPVSCGAVRLECVTQPKQQGASSSHMLPGWQWLLCSWELTWGFIMGL